MRRQDKIFILHALQLGWFFGFIALMWLCEFWGILSCTWRVGGGVGGGLRLT